MANQGNFADALQIPAIISMIKRVQHESQAELMLVGDYYKRCHDRGLGIALESKEKAALAKLLGSLVEHGINSVIFYIFAHLSCAGLGVFGGRLSQIVISANYMSAPGKEVIRPAAWLLSAIGVDPKSVINVAESDAISERVAYIFGFAAHSLGYGGEQLSRETGGMSAKGCRRARGTKKISISIPTVK